MRLTWARLKNEGARCMATNTWESASVALLVTVCVAQNFFMLFLGFCVMRAEAAAKSSERALLRSLRTVSNANNTTFSPCSSPPLLVKKCVSGGSNTFMQLCARYFGNFLLTLAEGATVEEALGRASRFQPKYPHSSFTEDKGPTATTIQIPRRPFASPLRLRAREDLCVLLNRE